MTMSTEYFTSQEIDYVILKVLGFTLNELTEIGINLLFEMELISVIGHHQADKIRERTVIVTTRVIDQIIDTSNRYALVHQFDRTERVSTASYELANHFYQRQQLNRLFGRTDSLMDKIQSFYFFMANVYYCLALLYDQKAFDFEGSYIRDFYSNGLSALDTLKKRDISVTLLINLIITVYNGMQLKF